MSWSSVTLTSPVAAWDRSDTLAGGGADIRSDADASVLLEHQPALKDLARALCKTPADAQDLLQDTMERALRRLRGGEPVTVTRAWLTTIMKNVFIDQCRTQK